MKIPSVKYMRDFYPDEMRLREWIEGHWRSASERAGFQPWDGPILEALDLYKRKSGAEIVGQLYTLTTRGGQELAIRPEMTPTLARMVAQRQASLPRPIKWYCISRMCRYERGQRGRLREFWQWNVDILGVADVGADAEVISVALDGLTAMGLDAADVEVRINSRRFLAAILRAIGIAEERHPEVYAVTDKRGRVEADVLRKMYEDLELPPAVLDRLLELMAADSLDDVERLAESHRLTGHEADLTELRRLFELLAALGKGRFCRFDIGIVRGLAYYTGPVFEIFDRGANLRAICGGGRYDHLLELMGAPPTPAVGFGLGDVVLAELLKEKGKLPAQAAGVDCHVIALDSDRFADALRIAQSLRRDGFRADYAMRPGALGKAMKRAGEAGARNVLLVGGREWDQGKMRLRNMATGTETELAPADLPRSLLLTRPSPATQV